MTTADREAFEKWWKNDHTFNDDRDVKEDYRIAYDAGLSRGREEMEKVRTAIITRMEVWGKIDPMSDDWQTASDMLVAFRQALFCFPAKPEENKEII